MFLLYLFNLIHSSLLAYCSVLSVHGLFASWLQRVFCYIFGLCFCKTQWVVQRVTWLCVIFWCHYEMSENNHAHSMQRRESIASTKLTVSTEHSWGKKHLRGKRQPYQLSLPWKSNFGIHEDCFNKLLNRKESTSLISAQFSHKCSPCLPSRWVRLGFLYPIMLLWFCWRSGWPKVKNLWLYNLKLEQAMRNLACGDQ